MRGISAVSIIFLISGIVLFLTGCQSSEQRIKAEMENLIIPADFRAVIDNFKEIHVTFYLEDVKFYSQRYIYETGEEISSIQTDRVSLSFGEEDDEVIVTVWFDNAGNIIEAEVTKAAHPVNDVEVLISVMMEGLMLLFKVDKYLEKTGQPDDAIIGDMKASVYCFETAKKPGKGIEVIRLYVADFGQFQTIVGREVTETGKFKAPGSREIIEKDGATTALIVEKIIIH